VQHSLSALVIGAGISGLSCAHFLRERGVSVHLVEASDRPGGLIRSVEQEGFHFELGPQSFLSSDILAELISRLHLEEQILVADSHAPRFILWHDRLVKAPMRPLALLGTGLFGTRTKLRLLTEMFRRSHPPDGDESVASFVRRKFGEDLLGSLVGPMVSGIYAGDPERLSLRAAFPEFYRFELEYGSVLRGAMKSRPERKATPSANSPRPPSGLCSFRDGVETLPRALAHSLVGALSYNAPLRGLRHSKSDGHAAFEAQVGAGGPIETATTPAIVLATPCEVSARLLRHLDPRFADAFGEIEYAPVAVVSVGYARSTVGNPLRGFGFLVPRSEGLRTLGCVWSSSLFPGRAPEGHVSIAIFAGGATDPEICEWEDDRIAQHVTGEIARVLQISAPPTTIRVQRYARALPQYNLGHSKTLDQLSRLSAAHPGLFFAGNYIAGPSLSTCVKQAQATSSAVFDYLASTGELHAKALPHAAK